LTYLVEEPYRRLVEGHPDIDRVIVVPAKQNRREFVGLIRAIRGKRFDVLLDFHGGPRASWITLASGARLKIGHAIKTKSFLYDKTAPRRGTDAPIHSVENHAGLVRALGATFEKADIPPLTLPPLRPDEAAHLDGFLRENGLPGSGQIPGPIPLVVLHIGAGNVFRDWGADNESVLASHLLNLPGIFVAVIGGRADQVREEEMRRRLSSSRFLPLAGILSLIETRELIARASLFIGPDSGPVHLAASTETPIVGYYGPTSPDVFGPWRPGLDLARTVLLQKTLACRPCRQHDCVTGDYRCLRTISPEDVLAAARPFIPR
jgi:ADP-heptose:LPS heptosyltransferase